MDKSYANDISFMKRALELAEKGIGFTNPNPVVGAVIVKDNRIIGEGYHEIYGGKHAETNAFLNSIEKVQGATMYVTLEPCSHFGKTPPCAKAIIDKGIKRVVVALTDPNPFVAGKGINMLRENGIEVATGIMEAESRRLNEVFMKYITTKLPFGILKTAITLDGKIATYSGDSKWITNEKSREYVHKLRHKVSAIMVGINTVLKDNPYLNTRLVEGNGLDAARVIVDSTARIPLDANVLNMKSSARTIIATTEMASKQKLEELEDKGADMIVCPLVNNRVDLSYLIKELGERGIDSILIEGGSALNYSAIEAGIVDKVIAFIAPKLIGGRDAKTPIGGLGKEFMKDALHLRIAELQRFGDDIMIEAYIRKE